MNKPAGTDELIDLISRSQVIEAEPLWQFLASRGGAAGLPADAGDVVGELVRAGLLSEYQGERLLAGDAAGLVVGKYQLIDRLGPLDSSVFLGVRRPGGQRVALKLLACDGDVPAPLIERFRREAQALARLDHPGVVAIKDSGEDAGRLFLVMEYIDGESLAEIVQHHGPLAPAPAARIVHAALDALAHIHQAGLVHRNLEPGHLLVDSDDRVRIVDLGLARFLDDPRGNLTVYRGSSQLLGTVAYQSPEQLVNSHDVDIRTDVYALGAIFYFLLTGKAPFSQHALLRLAAGVVTHPQPLAQLRPDVPRELVTTVETMMAQDRSQRYQTPGEATQALDRWLNEVSPPPLRVARRTPAPEDCRLQIADCRLQNEESDNLQSAISSLQSDKPASGEKEPGWPSWVLAGLLFVATAAVALVVMASSGF